jgi:2-polyprenyl-3-methyl-5-hydroxy-6-metoxy-1,4-benzoquinol methylase
LSEAAPDVETASEGYARRFSGGVGAWFLDVQARLVSELLAPFPRARVLEYGGGHGQLTPSLLDAGHQVTVYGSAGACGARLRAVVDARRATWREGDLARAPFPDRAFDVVLAFRLLPHVADWRALLAELCRLAARAVVVDYPTARSVNAVADLMFGLKHAVEGDTRRFAVFRDLEVRDAFLAHHFFVSARRPEFFWPMALHRAHGRALLARGLEAAAGATLLRRAFGSPVVLRAERADGA